MRVFHFKTGLSALGLIIAGALPATAPAAGGLTLPAAVAKAVGPGCSAGSDGPEAARYTVDGDVLWLVPCGAGAYQTPYHAVFVPKDGAPRVQMFAEWRAASWTGSDLLFDPTYNAKTRTLTDQYKARGRGGCGGQRTWQWVDGHFRLLQYRAQEDCDAPTAGYPTVFSAQRR